MKNKKTVWLLPILFVTAITFFQACTDPNETGLGVLPDDDLITANYIDTLSLNTLTLRDEKTTTSDLSRTMLGNYIDPLFGRINASSYIQFRTDAENITFDTLVGLAVDSVILTLDFREYYGRYDDPLVTEVYEMTGTFVPEEEYFSTNFIPFDSSRELSENYLIDFRGAAKFTDVNIPLDTSFGRKILDLDSSALSNADNFIGAFKGLHIRTQPIDLVDREPGGVFFLDMLSGNTVITIYYHSVDPDTSVDIFGTLELVVDDDDSRRYSRVIRTEFEDKFLGLETADTTDLQPDFLFVQSGALINAFFKFPHVEDLYPSSISRADMIFKVDPETFGSDDRFAPPDRLFIFLADSSERERLSELDFLSVADYDPIKQIYSAPITNTSYRFMIHGIDPINGLENHGLIIVPNSNGATLNRAVLGGPGHPELAPELRIVRTEIPE